ncbi:MAG: HEAT repeat domain-containing protein [Actinomycetota bacterium]
MEHSIDKIRLLKPDESEGTAAVLDSGQLVVEGEETLEFRGKKGTLAMTPIREIAVNGNVVIQYGEAAGMRSATFSDYRSGARKTKSQNQTLAEELRSWVKVHQRSEIEEEAVKQQEAMVAEAHVKRARKRMWFGGGATVLGAIATAIGFSMADDSGGTYYVFWGAVLFGGLTFLQGLLEYNKFKQPAGEVKKIPSGAGTDVPALRAAGDIDGLIQALWVNELEIRAAAIEALAELNDGTVADRLIPKLGDVRWDVRWSAAETLGKLGDPRAIEPLKGMLKDPNAFVRAVAEQSIKALEGAEA